MEITEKHRPASLPGENISAARAPGHWLLARMGKRVLRPGGLELTRHLLAELQPGACDEVVELAPGMGMTARMTIANHPRRYTAVERDPQAAAHVRQWLGHRDDSRQVVVGLAQQTGLPDASATIVYGEAMLSMQGDTAKRQIVHEAFRLLRPGGRYGIHELCLGPDDLPADEADTIRRSVTSAIHHKAAPLLVREWEALLESEGFEIRSRRTVPMALLEPGRLLRDEGLLRTAMFFLRLLINGEARRRVRSMRAVFREHRNHLAAICLVACKPDTKAI